MSAPTVRLDPVVYGDHVTCTTRLQGIFLCGSPATSRALVSCVHEHVRWIANCTRCARDIRSEIGSYCRVCAEDCGARSHEGCELREFVREPLGAQR